MAVVAALRHRLANSAPGWELKNLAARLRYRRLRSSPGPAEARAIARLRADGIAVTPASALFPAEAIGELSAFAATRWEQPEVQAGVRRRQAGGGAAGKKARFLIDLMPQGGELSFANPFIRFSLAAPVLGVVNAYLGMFARFRAFTLQATVPLPGTTAFASQRWHADPDDRKLVKVFLYLSDVDATAGPFTYIRGSHGTGRWRSLFPYAPKRKSRHPDPGIIERLIPPEDIVVVTGPVGTLIFCDTSGIHRGGYATAEPRIMWTGVYTTPASALPTRFRAPARPAAEALAPAARWAISP